MDSHPPDMTSYEIIIIIPAQNWLYADIIQPERLSQEMGKPADTYQDQRGIESINSLVYSEAGRANNSSPVPSSTSFPSFMTRMRSDM